MPIDAAVLLCSAATEQGGPVSVLGMGWQVRPPDPVATEGIVVALRVPRSEEGPVALRLELLRYGDETIVEVPPPEGPGEMMFAAEITVTGRRDLGLKAPLSAIFPLNIPAYPLEAGTEFLWRLHVNGKTHRSWTAPFRTMTTDERALLPIPGEDQP